MRKLIGYIVVVIAMALAVSCSLDKGNYDYISLDEPVISGLEDVNVMTFEHLSIVPSVEGVSDGIGIYPVHIVPVT